MNAVVIGADRLGNIPEVLAGVGIRIAHHVSGRDSAHQRRAGALPRNVDLMILFTDFLGHNVMKSFRAQARAEGIPVVACRRSVSCLVQALKAVLGITVNNSCAQCPLKSSSP